MENTSRLLCALFSFIIPLVGITLYFTHNKKYERNLYGVIAFIGILVYLGIGYGFI